MEPLDRQLVDFIIDSDVFTAKQLAQKLNVSEFPSANPLLEQIKREYLMAYHIASSTCIALQKEYGKPIPEAEIGFFAVLFALALQKTDRPPRKSLFGGDTTMYRLSCLSLWNRTTRTQTGSIRLCRSLWARAIQALIEKPRFKGSCEF